MDLNEIDTCIQVGNINIYILAAGCNSFINSPHSITHLVCNDNAYPCLIFSCNRNPDTSAGSRIWKNTAKCCYKICQLRPITCNYGSVVCRTYSLNLPFIITGRL